MKYKFLFIWTEIFLRIIFVTGFSHLSDSRGVVIKDTKQECTFVGGRLIDFNGLRDSHLQQEILSQLGHGESAWIEGSAEFSSFIAWYGCVASLKDVPGIYKTRLQTQDLYSCVEICSQRNMNATFVGIEQRHCFCFNFSIRKTLSKYFTNVYCSSPCSAANIGLCGGANITSIYRIVNDIIWAENEPSPRQCVYIERQERFVASTSSCFTLFLPEYICTRQLFLNLNTSDCNKPKRLRNYCLVSKFSTRQEAFNNCLDKNGTLIEYYGEQQSLSLMQVGRRYWLSVFRTFRPSYVTNGVGCLSVTKISDNLYLDPDSCVTQKPYLCEISNNYTSTSSRSKNARYATRKYKSTKPVATSTKDSKYHAVDSSSLPTTFAVRSSKSPATVITIKDSVYNTTSALTTESDVANTTCNTQRFSVGNCSFKQRSLQPLSLSLSLDTVTTPLVQTTVSRTATPNEPQLICYILSSSFVFIIFVVSAVCLVVCMRKRKQQLQSHKKGHSASAVSEGITVSFSRNYQNVDRNASNTVTETEGLGSESQEDQYDRVHSIELKTEDCHQINQYDHTPTGATNSCINVDHTSFIHTEGRSSNSFPLFDSNKTAVSDHRIQAPDSREKDEDIYAMYLHAMSE